MASKTKVALRFGDKIDFSRWGVVSYNDDTGLGRQATDMRKVLKLGYFFVIPSQRLTTKRLQDDREYLVPWEATEEYLLEVLKEVQGVFILERLTHHLPLVQAAKKMGVTVACVPNWEHFAGWLSLNNQADIFLCPSEMTHRFLRLFGFANAVQVPTPIDLDLFPVRSISGPARHFIHNGGVMYKDDRKATREVIEAFKQVPRKDIRLTVRLQKKTSLPDLDPRITVVVANLEHPAELYAEGDVAIQPSKLEGIGFSIVEAALSGMPVITSNYPPMNELVREKNLLCKVGWLFHKTVNSRSIHHAHLKMPDVRDLAKKIEWCAENDMEPFSIANHALRTETFEPEKVEEKWRAALQAYADGCLASVLPRRPLSLMTPLFFVSAVFFRTVRSFFAWRKKSNTGGAVSGRAKNSDPVRAIPPPDSA